jgi:hypothetical protein
MAESVDFVEEMSRMFVGSVLTRIERKNEYIRWYFVRDDGIEMYYQWHESLRTTPQNQWPEEWKK